MHRKIMESSIYGDAHAIHLFLHLLLKSNHEDRKFCHGGQMVEIKRGQHLTGIFQLSGDLNTATHIIRTRLKMLEAEGIITVKSTNKYSIITVCKYDIYQSMPSELSKQEANKTQTGSKQESTNKNKENDKDFKEVNTSGTGNPSRALTDHYLSCLKMKGITYIPPDKDYIVFAQGRKKYKESGMTDDQIKNYLSTWFDLDIGSWCGYKLSNFWSDIGKIQSPEKRKDNVPRMANPAPKGKYDHLEVRVYDKGV